MLFDPLCNDQWLETELGRYVFSRQEKLILDLVSPAAGESLLDIGCDTGNFLRIFQVKKCLLTGSGLVWCRTGYCKKQTWRFL